MSCAIVSEPCGPAPAQAASALAAAALIDSAGPAGENRWAAACVDRARGRLDDDPDLIQQATHAFAAIDARFEQACTDLSWPPPS
jgi:hypothetical protein